MTTKLFAFPHNWQNMTALIGRYQAALRTVLCWGLVATSLWILAQLIWLAVAPPDKALPNVTKRIQPTLTASGQIDIQPLLQAHIFGQTSAATQPTSNNQSAPKTKLNLQLNGVVASAQAELGAAIISYNNNQGTYGVGEKIAKTRVILAEVYTDRVIINNAGQRETLMLDGVDYTKTIPTTDALNNETAGDVEQAVSLTDTAQREALKALRQQPENFTQFMNVTPFRNGAGLLGYQVSPGTNASLFAAAGLQNGDIITNLNGLDLSDLRESMQAPAVLKESQMLELTVIRGEQTVYLTVELPSAD